MVLHYLLLLFERSAKPRDRSSWLSAPSGFSLGGPGNPRADYAGTFQGVAALFEFCVFLFVWMNVPWVFLTLPACF